MEFGIKRDNPYQDGIVMPNAIRFTYIKLLLHVSIIYVQCIGNSAFSDLFQLIMYLLDLSTDADIDEVVLFML